MGGSRSAGSGKEIVGGLDGQLIARDEIALDIALRIAAKILNNRLRRQSQGSNIKKKQFSSSVIFHDENTKIIYYNTTNTTDTTNIAYNYKIRNAYNYSYSY